MAEPLKIAVCIKQVPETAEVQFDPERKTIVREGVHNVVNAFDRRAVTEAVRLKQELGATITVVTMGPPQAREALVECLAMGADDAIHLSDRTFAGSDTLATARALALVLQREPYDLIFCGRYSTDAETGQVGPEVAALLDLPQVTGVSQLEVIAEAAAVRATRETDEGFEVVEAPLPVLLTTAERLNRPIKVGKSDLEAAAEKPVATLAAADLAADPSVFGAAGSPTRVTEIYPATSPRQLTMLEGTPAEAARELARVLVERGLFGEWQGVVEPRRAPASVRPATGPAVWVVAEEFAGQLRGVTFELLGRSTELAARLGGHVAAVMLGADAGRHVGALAAHGADRVYLAESEVLGQYLTEAWTHILARAIRAHQPYAVLIPATANGRDFAPRVAARLGLGLTGDCVGLEIDAEGRLVQLKPAFGGNIIAPILSRTLPQMATIRPGMLERLAPAYERRAEVAYLDTDPGEVRTRVVGADAAAGAAGVALDDAEVVVVAGAGLGSSENLEAVRTLAETMGAALGASRKVVDLGWLPRQQQIGITGKAVAPRLYLGVCVRGALNHLIGMQRSGIVAAIDINPQAEIFRAADYGVVGDWREVLPELTAALRQARQEREAER